MMTVSEIWLSYRDLARMIATLQAENAELKREVERLRSLLSALELGGTTERERPA